MKTVFSNSEITHCFANQLQENGRTSSGGMFFRNNKLYSYGYHYILAQHVTNEAGERAILLNERRYSNSTAKQQGLIWRASRHLKQICVPTIGDTKEDIFAVWVNELEEIAEKLLKAKKPEIYINQIDSIKNQVDEYIFFFGYTLPDNLHKLLSIESKEDSTAVIGKMVELRKKAAELKKKQEAKELKLAAAKFKEDLIKWRNFEKYDLYNRFTDLSYLRFNSDKNRIETSQRIEIPVELAKRYYKQILESNKNGGCKNCDYRFLEYQVKEINSKFIQVGCHKITIEEVNRIAKQLNF